MISAIALGLGGLPFREEELSFDALETGPLSEWMKSSAPANSNVLTISWLSPAVPFMVTCPTMHQAMRKPKNLLGKFVGEDDEGSREQAAFKFHLELFSERGHNYGDSIPMLQMKRWPTSQDPLIFDV